MEITSTLTRHAGELASVVYRDIGSEMELEGRKVKTVHAYSFYGDQLVVVYAENKGLWTPPGGGVEAGETLEQAVLREVKEESNMKVLMQRFIGYQDISAADGMICQTRSVCIVEPYGHFVGDPDGDITKIELIDPKDYRKYFDWGEIGDHIMQRALELKTQMALAATKSNKS